MPIWSDLTAFGGLPFTGMVVLAVTLTLLLAAPAAWRLIVCWCAALMAGMTIATISQLAFLGWGIGIEDIHFAGFSGHATRAAAVFPVACFVVTMRYRHGATLCAVSLGALAAALVAVSRVMIGAHSVSEAVAGYLLGTALALPVIWYARNLKLDVSAVPLATVCLAALLTGTEPAGYAAPITHQWLTGMALNLSGQDRPYSRANWQREALPYLPPCPIQTVRFRYLCM